MNRILTLLYLKQKKLWTNKRQKERMEGWTLSMPLLPIHVSVEIFKPFHLELHLLKLYIISYHSNNNANTTLYEERNREMFFFQTWTENLSTD